MARTNLTAALVAAILTLSFAPPSPARPRAAPPEFDARATAALQATPPPVDGRPPLHAAPPQADAQASPAVTPTAADPTPPPSGFDIADGAVGFGLGALATLGTVVAVGRRRRADIRTAQIAS
jgi:hypothetical protein